MVPIAVVDRARAEPVRRPRAPPAQALARARIPEQMRRDRSPDRKPPAWVYLHGLKSPLSSTALRALRRRS